MAVLSAAINADPNPAKGGGDIIIDDDALVPAISPDSVSLGEGKPTSDQITIYSVRAGDTLTSIAKMFNVSVNTIRWSNDLSSTKVIKIGQELVILPVNGVRYTVKTGDTIQSIAKKYKGDIDEILNYNVISLDDKLVVGQSIVIPDGIIATPPVSVSGARIQSANKVSQYSGPELVGYYIRPVPGPKTQGIHGNNGLDLGGPTGTTVMSAASGEVIIARSTGWNGGYGEMIVITHPNGTQTLYGHLSEVNVNVGQYVVQGQKIGEIGSTGRSTGPHLHFEVRGAKNPF
ncbi:MAG TPA: M23 family metallopeptidase [Candidatus Paceibacterota bacterium]